VLYFLEEKEGGRIKVGFSTRPIERIRALQTSTSGELAVIDVVQGDRTDERLLHERLTRMGKRLRGEWFVDDAEVRAVLAAYRDGSVYRSIQQEKALRNAQSVLDDMHRAIEQLRSLLKKR
jgi:(2Fe-2S) ferredoxin